MIGQIFERETYHFEERFSLIRDLQPDIYKTSVLLTQKKNVSSSWLQTNTRKIHERDKQTWLLEYSVDPCDRGLKLGHSYQTYNVYLCHTDANLSIATTIQVWLQWSEVEHGRSHLITSQWCEPLTSAREIIINVNDSQGNQVQSIECE